MFRRKDKKPYEPELVNTRASGTYGGAGTMDDAVIRIGNILMERGFNDQTEAEIKKILDSEVRCAKCSGRFVLHTGVMNDPKLTFKAACPYCRADAGFRIG
jgi:hypothetical protein